MFARPVRRGRPVAVAAAVVAGLVLLWPASPVLPDDERPAPGRTGPTDPGAATARRGDGGPPQVGGAEPVPPTAVFAVRDGLRLHLPAPEVRLVAYHEAALPAALALEPVGTLLANDNTTKYAPGGDRDGPGYVVLSSRGRPHPATSATDVVLEPGEAVRSPVTGRVAEVRPYLLYGEHADTRIEIAPEDHPTVRVVLIHVERPAVRAGDRVVAGRTVLADRATLFPFSSHVDRFLEPERLPHVHLEVKAPRSGR